MKTDPQAPLLDVQHLRVSFVLRRGVLHAVDDVSFSLQEKESLGIVGETGCGKSITGLSIMGLVPCPPGRVSGRILLEGGDLIGNDERQWCRIRGRKIAMIFQEPLTALNPSFTAGEQIAECYRVHLGHSKRVARDWAEHILAAVRVPSPRLLMKLYPHELSGGLRQRVMIAMALACQPKLLIADEPTTALDVTVQAQILELLQELREKMNLAMIFISHDLDVVARLCDRIALMYGGNFVELADVRAGVFAPLHPYGAALLASRPRPDNRDRDLQVLPGNVCDLVHPPSGCKFHPRCSKARERCAETSPLLQPRMGSQPVACFYPGDA